MKWSQLEERWQREGERARKVKYFEDQDSRAFSQDEAVSESVKGP
jgi:uncharacterized protein YkuJ